MYPVKKVLASLFLAVCIVAGAQAQNPPKNHKEQHFCVYHGAQELSSFFGSQLYKARPSQAAVEKFARLCEVAGQDSKQYNLVALPGVMNAYAYQYGPVREIGYGPQFLNWIDKNGDGFSGFSVVAHELGHHVMGMGVLSPYETELQADEFAGFVLGRMGATLKQSVWAIHLIGSEEDGPTHPNKYARAERIARGWNKALAGKAL